MMEDEELVGRQRELSVGLPVVVREFDLAGTIEEFHNRANLPAQEPVRGHIRQESDDIQQVWRIAQCHGLYFTKQLVKRGAFSPRRTIHMLLTTPVPREPLTSNSST